MNETAFDIDGIGNHYGCLEVKHEDGKYFWGIENWDGTAWQEIPESLYTEIKRFHEAGEEVSK